MDGRDVDFAVGVGLVVLLDEDEALDVKVDEGGAAGFAGAAVEKDKAGLGIEKEESDVPGWASADVLIVDDAAVRRIKLARWLPRRDFRDDPVREGADGQGGVEVLVLGGMEDVLDVEVVGEVVGVDTVAGDRRCGGFGAGGEMLTWCELVWLFEADDIAPLEEGERDVVWVRGRLVRFSYASTPVARKKDVRELFAKQR